MKKTTLILFLSLFLPLIAFSQVANSSKIQAFDTGEHAEYLFSQLKSYHVITTLRERTSISDSDLRVFMRFYKDQFAKKKSAFHRAVHKGVITNSNDVKLYAGKLVNNLVTLYGKFLNIKKNYPSSLAQYSNPVTPSFAPTTCNPACSNIGFDNGTLSSWTACYAQNVSTSSSFATTVATCFGPLGAVTTAAYDPSTSSNQVSVTAGAGFDPVAGAFIPVVCPTGGTNSCRVGDGTGTDYGVAVLEQTFQVTTGNENFTYMYAAVLESAGHPYYFQPWFKIELLDALGNPIPNCGQYFVVASDTTKGYKHIYYPPNGDTVFCKPWTTVFVPLKAYIGQCVTIRVTSSDCGYGGHFGYAYFDATCSPLSLINSSPAICGKNITLTAPPGGSKYSWTGPCIVGPSNDSTVTVSCAGIYRVVITPVTGSACNDTLYDTVKTVPPLTVTSTNTNEKCFGGKTATASVTASGGTTPYTYLWKPSGGTSSSASGLSAGTYTCEVTGGCVDSAVITITQPPALTATITTIPVKCNGGTTGTATVTAGGGTGAYTYAWTPGGSTSSSATGLSAGTYTLTETDANGCTFTTTATITQPTALTATTSSTAATCGNSNGSAKVTAGGGTGTYTYSWTPGGQTNATASNISAGTYTVTVTDANGCTKTASVVVSTTSGETVTTSQTNVSCFGGSNATASATVTGGTSPYTYAWTPGGQTTSSVTGLTAGSYTVTVTDHTGCTITSLITITQPTQVTVTTAPPVNELCNGGSNGSDLATGSGGTGPYIYAWTPGGQTNANATGLSAGTYTVTAKDANGCTGTASVTITQPTALTCTTTTNPATCGNSDGSATATPAGGTGTYTYSWSPGGQTGAIASNISAGTYTVTVKDANGCTVTVTAAVANTGGASVTITNTNELCNGGSNATANTTVSGGTSPYTYAWTGGQTNANATGLTAGSYTVTVTDANGCVATASVTITQPPLLTVTTGAPVNVLCNGGTNGSVASAVVGGTGAYTYSWTSGQTNANATGLSAGTYTVTVTDANGCTATASATITQPAILAVTTGAAVNVLCNGGANGSDLATASGGTGTYTYSWNTIPVQTNANATGLTAGTYTITVTDANGCTASASATVTQPAALTATTTTVPSSCGNANGSATATPAGGTGTYTYSWNTSPIQTNATASSLTAATYTVTITDANGCTLTTTATVTNISAETVTINPPVNILCNGGNNGSATSTVVGGTTPYTYSWSTIPIQTNANATGLTAGTYTLSVTDASGCLATASVTITQPALLTVTTASPVNILCNGGNNGSDIATAAGGTGTYTYAWTPGGQSNANSTGLTAGTYTITVTDANGCTASATTTITQPPVLTINAAGFPVSCNGGSNGQATVIPAGGTAPYSYNWSNGNTGANDNNLTAGNYTITVTDANGCFHDTTVVVTQPAPIVVAFKADSLNGCAPLCVNFTDGSTDPGGTITKWSWAYSDGGKDTVKDPRHCFINPGTDSVSLTVTDNHGCTASLMIPDMITVYSFPVAAFNLSPQPTTILSPTIQFTDKSTDAYGIASWLWNFNDPANDIGSSQQNPSHTYSDTGSYCAMLTVTNIHGCKDSVTECLVIAPEYSLYIPNAFSPNGDGKNDVFLAKGEFVENFKMYIFDRWGMLLFYSDDINKGWPGTVNNGSTICQEDTYVYLIQATDNQGEIHKYIGKVTLLK
jgi:gliding motility-associated-like protein